MAIHAARVHEHGIGGEECRARGSLVSLFRHRFGFGWSTRRGLGSGAFAAATLSQDQNSGAGQQSPSCRNRKSKIENRKSHVTRSSARMGSRWMRLPVAAKIALATAGAI